MLFDTLKTSNAKVIGVELGGNEKIGDECMASLGEYIKDNKSISDVRLDGTQVTDHGVEILASYLGGNTTFKRLVFDRCKGITDKSVPVLIKMIETSSIVSVDAYEASISDVGVFAAPISFNIIKRGSDNLDLSGK